MQPVVDHHELSARAGRHRRRRAAAAGRRAGVAPGTVDDRDRPGVVAGDVDGVAGLVDGDPERAAAHRDGCRNPPAAAAGAAIAGGPVNHRHRVAIARGPGVRRVDGVGRGVDIDPGRAGLVLDGPGRPSASGGPAAITPGRVDDRDAAAAKVRHVQTARRRVERRGDRELADLDRGHGPTAAAGHPGVAPGAIQHRYGAACPVHHINGVGPGVYRGRERAAADPGPGHHAATRNGLRVAFRGVDDIDDMAQRPRSTKTGAALDRHVDGPRLRIGGRAHPGCRRAPQTRLGDPARPEPRCPAAPAPPARPGPARPAPAAVPRTAQPAPGAARQNQAPPQPNQTPPCRPPRPGKLPRSRSPPAPRPSGDVAAAERASTSGSLRCESQFVEMR